MQKKLLSWLLTESDGMELLVEGLLDSIYLVFVYNGILLNLERLARVLSAGDCY